MGNYSKDKNYKNVSKNVSMDYSLNGQYLLGNIICCIKTVYTLIQHTYITGNLNKIETVLCSIITV